MVHEEQQWWDLPGLHPAATLVATAQGDKVANMLYTAKQLEDWRHTVTFPDKQETVPSMMAAGLCGQKNRCPWMEHTTSSFLLSCLKEQVESSLYHLILPEPFATLVDHLQLLVIVAATCVMIV